VIKVGDIVALSSDIQAVLDSCIFDDNSFLSYNGYMIVLSVEMENTYQNSCGNLKGACNVMTTSGITSWISIDSLSIVVKNHENR